MKKSRLTKAAAESAAAATEAGRNIQDDAVERVAAIPLEAQRKAAPLARKAGKRAADSVSKHLDTWEPHIRGVLDQVPSVVDTVHKKVASGLLPSLQQTPYKVVGHKPAPVEKQKCKGGKFRKLAKLVFISSLVAGIVTVVRHFLMPKDDGWTACESSRAHINNNGTFATVAKFNEPVTPIPQSTTPTLEAPRESFDESSYAGPNLPEGHIFKGNERSKKYHIPGTRGYELTIAEVWLNSEEVTEAVGFTKAQR